MPVSKKIITNQISLVLMIALYVYTGINHFINPQVYKQIMPPWIPEHDLMVIISGVCEILFALLLIFPSTRRIGAWCIIVLLVAVFPANIQMLVNYIEEDHPRLWIAISRLPLQILLIWWACSFTKPMQTSEEKI